MHRGVYGRYRDVVPNERALYHLVPARWFNAQLPIGAGRDGYVTEDFHVLGGIETFRDLDKLLAHANEQLAERRGYFYVMQLDFDRPEAKTFRRDETRVSSRREKTEEKKNAERSTNENALSADSRLTANVAGNAVALRRGPIVGTPPRARAFALRAVAQHVGGARVRLEVVPQCADDHLVHTARRGRVRVARQRLERGDEGPTQEVEVRRVVPGPAQRGGRDGRSGVATRVSSGSIQRHHARVRAAKQGRRFGRSLFLPPSLDDVGVHRVAVTRHRPIGASSSRPRLLSSFSL